MKAAAILSLTILALSVSVTAQSFELSSAGNQALGGAAIMSEPRPVDWLSVISVGAGQGLTFQADYLRQFEMTEFTTCIAAAQYRRSAVIAALGFSQFGQGGLYADKTVRGLIGLALQSVAAGLVISGRRLEFGGDYASLSAASIGVSGSYQRGRCAFGATCDNLNRPRFAESGPSEPRRLSLFAEYVHRGEFQLVARLTAEEDQDTRIAVGQQIALSSKARILWGVHSAPFEYGGALQLTISRFELTFATTYHPVLGFSTAGGLLVSVGPNGKGPK